MRRSQRLIGRKSIAKAEFIDGAFLHSDNQRTKINLQIQKSSTYNESAANEGNSPRAPALDVANFNEGKTNISMPSQNLKTQVDETNEVLEMDNKNNNTQAINTKLKQPLRKRSSTTKRAIDNSTSHVKTNNQPSKRRRIATTKKKLGTPIISIDHYLNPLRHPLLPAETKVQPMENNDFKWSNNIRNIHLKSSNDSLLPPLYPMHFVNQNFANTPINQPTPAQMLYNPTQDTNVQQTNPYPTPELTQSLDFESSTSTISLPESLRDVFGCEDIREVLQMDKIIFRIRSLHLQTLAFVLNIQFEYLYALVEKIMQLDSGTLQKIVYAFKPVMDTINSKTENKDD